MLSNPVWYGIVIPPIAKIVVTDCYADVLAAKERYGEHCVIAYTGETEAGAAATAEDYLTRYEDLQEVAAKLKDYPPLDYREQLKARPNAGKTAYAINSLIQQAKDSAKPLYIGVEVYQKAP